jgi:hypothetical protein
MSSSSYALLPRSESSPSLDLAMGNENDPVTAVSRHDEEENDVDKASPVMSPVPNENDRTDELPWATRLRSRCVFLAIVTRVLAFSD